MDYWGFIDRSGKIIVQPLLNHAEDFSEGYALVTVDLDQVTVEKDGQIVSRESPAPRRHGKAALHPKSQKQCFIDVTGKVVSKLFDSSTYDCYISNGVAMVHQAGGPFILYTEHYGYIDRAGNWIIPPTYPEAHPFCEGLGRVRPSGLNKGRLGILEAGPIGYVDPAGKMAIPAQFMLARDFHEGRAAVSKDGKQWGYIDTSGTMVIQPEFTYADDFHEGLAVAAKEGSGLWGFIDKSGRWVIAPKYVSANPFSEGLARFKVARGDRRQYGFVNAKGVEVIPAEYDWASDFRDGLAPVSKNIDGTSKCGYIDREGHIVTPLTFDEAYPLAEGMGRIRAGDRYGYVDRTGKLAIAPQYVSADDFFAGLASVDLPGNERGSLCIDPSGKVIWRP